MLIINKAQFHEMKILCGSSFAITPESVVRSCCDAYVNKDKKFREF